MLAWLSGDTPVAIIVAVVSQKGGVGKSTIARLLAREFAAQDWKVKIADLDISQGTSFHWRARRLEHQIEPDIPVEQFGRVEQALKVSDQYDLIILDGAPHGSQTTRAMSQASNLTVIPTGLAVDDLLPAVTLAHELVKNGVQKGKIAFALCRVGNSPVEIEDARSYLSEAGYAVLSGALPEQVAYRRASDEGRALTETRFQTLNDRADELAQSMIDKIGELANTERSVA
jgi:chromosome partitioning protein